MNTSELVRGWVVSAGRHIAVALSGIVWLSVIAHRLPDADVGRLVLVVSMPALLVPILGLGVPMALSYLVSTEAYAPSELAAWTRRMLAVIGFGSLGLATVTLGGAYSLGRQPSTLVFAAVSMVPMATMSALVAAYFQGQRSFGRQAKILAAPFVLSAVGTIGLALAGSQSVDLYALALLASYAATALRAVQLLPQSDDPADLQEVWGAAWPFAWRTYVSEATAAARTRADIFVVALMLGTGAAGQFGTTTAVAAQLSILSLAANQVVFPMSAARSRSASAGIGGDDATATAARLTIALTLAGAVALALASKPLLGLLYGPSFESAWPVLVAYLPAVVLLSISRVLTADLYGRGETSIILRISLIATAVSVALLPACIALWGTTGAGVAASLGALANTSMRFRAYQSLTATPLKVLTVPVPGDARSMIEALRSS